MARKSKTGFVIGAMCSDGTFEITTHTTDVRNNQIPVIYKTRAEATIELGEHISSIGEAVKKGHMHEDRLDDLNDFIAEYEIDINGQVHIFVVHENENIDTLYEGHFNNLVK